MFSRLSVSSKNRGVWKGRSFWSGGFSTLDGEVLEVHKYEEAENSDFHHSTYFSRGTVELMSDEEAAFFWVDGGGIETDWCEGVASPEILRRLKEQVRIV